MDILGTVPNWETDCTYKNEKWTLENKKIKLKLGLILRYEIYSQEFALSFEDL